MDSSWFIGSAPIFQQDFTVDGIFGVGVPDGNYYLRSPVTARSLVNEMATRIVAAVGGTCVINLREGRTIRITFNANRTLTWGTATRLRDLLGFTADLPSDDIHDAPNVSPLLWSPGYPANPRTIEGVDGYTVPHQAIHKSSDGSQVHAAHYGSEQWQDLSWTHIIPDRMRLPTGTGGGTFHEFFEQCAMLRYRFLWHQSVNEVDASVTIATLDAPRGPYVLRPEFDGDWYQRNVPNAEVSSPLDLPLHRVDEYA